jgi:hypothetical protein
VYGLARIYIDGNSAQWDVGGGTAEPKTQRVLKLSIGLMGKT